MHKVQGSAVSQNFTRGIGANLLTGQRRPGHGPHHPVPLLVQGERARKARGDGVGKLEHGLVPERIGAKAQDKVERARQAFKTQETLWNTYTSFKCSFKTGFTPLS